MTRTKPFISRDEDELAKIATRLEQVQKQATELAERADSVNTTAEGKSVKDELQTVKDELASLTQAREKELTSLEMKSLRGQVESLSGAITEMRKPVDFAFGGGVPIPGDGSGVERVYGGKSLGGVAMPDGTRRGGIEVGGESFFSDIKAANKGDAGARERMMKALGTPEGKALTESSGATGGYLVVPEYSSELIVLREQAAIIRSLCSKINVTSTSLIIASVTSGMTAGWVAELATKPQADLAFGQITATVFTAAGLGVVSNQLLQDARPSIDGIIVADLAKRLATLEEIAFLNGTGSGQPLGILNTPGINAEALTATDVPSLMDSIVQGIVDIQTNYQGNPSHIVMHPRTWARIVKAREASAPSTYLIGAGSTAFGRRGNDPLPAGELFGLPVVLTKNIPTNLGGGANESRVIIGNFSEALILDRQGITVDESPHVYFTSNQTVFRSEERVGFTAARYPKAFAVVGGAGLANG